MAHEARAYNVTISQACTACGLCISTCPSKALQRAPQMPAVSPRRCTGCLECVDICPRDALSVVAVSTMSPAIDRPSVTTLEMLQGRSPSSATWSTSASHTVREVFLRGVDPQLTLGYATGEAT